MKTLWQLRASKLPLQRHKHNLAAPLVLPSQVSGPQAIHLPKQAQDTHNFEHRFFSSPSKGKREFIPQRPKRTDITDNKNRTGNSSRVRPLSPFRVALFSENEEDALRPLQMKTKALADVPFGSWTPLQWKDAVHTLYMWIEKESDFYGTPESVLTSFSLLERMLLEQKRSASAVQKHASRESMDTELLNDVIDNWRACWVSLQKPQALDEFRYGEEERQAKVLLEFTVADLLSRIDAYKARSSGLVVPDTNTYLLIKDAAAASYRSGKRSSFALDLLERIATESEVYDNTQLDYDTYVSFIKTCARVGDAEQAEECLEHMYKQFAKTGQPSLKPDTRLFNLILLAWSQSSGDAKYASQRSQGILKRMQKLSDKEGILEGAAAPSYMSYSLVIKCLVKWLSSLSLTGENAPRAKDYHYVGERAEEFLREMDAGAARGEKMMKPNTIVYNSVLHVWSLLGNAERAEKLLQVMYEDFKHGNFRAEPKTASFSTVLAAWANYQKVFGITGTTVTSSGGYRNTPEVGRRAEAILRRMQEMHDSGELKSVEPNSFSYSATLQCWANTRSPEAGERAESILREMKNKSRTSKKRLLSNAGYNSVLQAYAGAGNAKSAEAFLGRQLQEYRAGKTSAKPTAQNLTILLNAWSRSKDPQAPLRAEGLLKEMWSLWKEGILDRPPNVVSYSTVLDCLAKSSLPGAAKRAEELLEEMIAISKKGNANVRPNVISYRNVLNAYARTGNVKKTEEIVERMFDDYKRGGNMSARPNLKTLNLVLAAFSNSNYTDAAERAEAYLRYLQDLYDRNLIDEKPNVISYTIVLKCLSRSSSANAGQEAERIINEMEEQAIAQSDDSLRPNTMSWSTAIQAYARAGEPEKAEALLERMYTSYKNGNIGAKPNARTFTNVLQAWCTQRSGTQRAMAILDWMKELHNSKTLDDVKPNMITYATVLGGLARQRQRDSAELAVSLLKDMEELAAAGDTGIKPNDVCYNNTMTAFAKIGDARRVQELLAQMYHSHKQGTASHKPTLASWNIILSAWSRSSDPEAAAKAEAVVKRMYELYESGMLDEKPNAISYTTMLSCWVSSESRDRVAQVEALLDRMDALKNAGDRNIYAEMHDYSLAIRPLCQMKDDRLIERAEVLLRRMLKEFDRSHPKWKSGTADAFNSIITAWSKSRHPQSAARGDRLRREMHALMPDAH